ncbi:MAG TPA: F0F1 ATP synthase subunit A [Burkholderiales bacterium]|nr:F0F1 ATP synthase subunit A [Burkholderiales bacterium]
MNPNTIFQFGPFGITRTVVTTWGLLLVLAALAWLATRRLALRPSGMQAAVEGIVEVIDNSVRALLPDPPQGLVPLIGTLWIFIITANLVGVIPGLSSPTDDLSLTAGLALLVFLSVHWFGIRRGGVGRYLHQYLEPNPMLVPFHIVSEMSRTVTLAVRLFGNIMSLEIAAALVLLVAGLLIPVPILMLHIVEALVQAYIFGMLALVYISGGIQSHSSSGKGEQP